MNVSLFAEFPWEDLEKLSLVNFPVKVYLAASSLEEYRELEKHAKEINPQTETAYWPILEKSYWVSPFSYNRELDRLHLDLSRNEEMLEILLDLELPKFWIRYVVYHLPRVLANAFKYHLRITKPRIRKLFKMQDNYNIRITSTSYPVMSKYYLANYLTFKLLGFLGVHFNPRAFNHRVIFMCYSSIRGDLLRKTLKNISAKKPGVRENYQVGLGLLDYGMLSKTGFIRKLQRVGLLKGFHLLTPEKLDRDLSLVKEQGVRDVTIYDLGGLSEELVEVIGKYVSREEAFIYAYPE
jgi:hypothetical protein